VLSASDEHAATARAWRGVLSGASDDFSACGTSTLDEWAVELLAGFDPSSDRRTTKKELRRQGVAAFGMRVAA
jgi:hypothetical protein